MGFPSPGPVIRRIADFLQAIQTALRGPADAALAVHLPLRPSLGARPAALAFGMSVAASLAALPQTVAADESVDHSVEGVLWSDPDAALATWHITLDGEPLWVVDLKARQDLLGLSLARAGVPDTALWRSVFQLAVNHVTAWDVNRMARCSVGVGAPSPTASRDAVQRGLDRLVSRYAEIIFEDRDRGLYGQVGDPSWGRLEQSLWNQAQAWRLSGGAYASSAPLPFLSRLDDDCRLRQGVTARQGEERPLVAEHDPTNKSASEISNKQIGESLWRWVQEASGARPFLQWPSDVQLSLASRFEHAGLLENPAFLSGTVHVGMWDGEWIIFPEAHGGPEAWFTPSGSFALIGRPFITEQLVRWSLASESSQDRPVGFRSAMSQDSLKDVLLFVVEHEVGHLKRDEEVLASLGERVHHSDFEREAVEAVERHADLWAIERLRAKGWTDQRIESTYVMSRQLLADEHKRGFEREGWQPCLLELVAYQDAIMTVHRQIGSQ